MDYDIVIVEDEMDLGNVVSEYLKLRGFGVKWFRSASDTLTYYRRYPSTNKLIIIDIQLPDRNGFDLAAEIMGINKNQAFFFLTARNGREDRLRGFQMGAIDYIAKPFEIEELVLRVGNVISKLANGYPTLPEEPEFIRVGDVKYNKRQLLILLPEEREMSLTRREAELLDFLLSRLNQVVKKREILLALWGDDDYFNGKSLEVFISRLRRVFKVSQQVSIENVYGLGYMLRVK